MTLGDAFEPESNFQTELLRHCLLNSADVDVRMNLYHYEHLPLNEFVKHADQLLQCKQGLHIFSSAHTLSSTPVSPPPHNQHVINELLESRLKNIQECVNNLADSTIRHRLHNMPPLAEVGTSANSQIADSSFYLRICEPNFVPQIFADLR